jgi:hypothetical protein
LASGVRIFIGQEWWRTLTIVGAALSVVVLVVYLHPWYWFALVLNAGIFLALLWAHWPLPVWSVLRAVAENPYTRSQPLRTSYRRIAENRTLGCSARTLGRG